MNNYIVIDNRGGYLICTAENGVEAVTRFAGSTNCRISNSLFVSAARTLNLAEVIELYNALTCTEGDKINAIYTGFTTLYKQE